MQISEVRYHSAADADRAAGLLGWISATLDGGLRLDGLALRRTLSGRLVLSYPSRTDAAGRRHFYLRPIHDAARRDLEAQVLRAIGLEEDAAR